MSNSVSDFFRYHGVWAPGVRLFRAIGFRAKALVISTVFMVPIAVLAYSYFADKGAAIDFSAKERQGVVYLKQVVALLPQMQRERLLAARAAAGNGAAAQLHEVRQQVEAGLRGLQDLEASLGSELQTGKAHARLVEAGKALAPAGGYEAVFAAHTKRIQALLDLLSAANDGSNLILDPDLDSFYVMDAATDHLPAIAEALAKVHGWADPAARPGEQRRLIEQHMVLEDNASGLASGLGRAFDYNPALKASIDPAALLSQVAAAAKIAEGSAPRQDDLRADALQPLWSSMLTQLDGLLETRVSNLQRSRAVTTTVLLIGLLTALYMFMAFRKVLDGGLKEVAFHIDAMRDGNLTTQPRAWGADEAAGLMHTLVDMQSALRRIVSQVRGAADSIVVSSTQITSGAHDLSNRTEKSAANLEESAAAMEQIASTVKQTAASAQEASQLATRNADVATRGGEVIGTMVETMRDIHASSSRIGDIIGTIDGIAFQTNILALNAAVEAARAGEAGRGFAVVATEVRALAGRASAAAREIKGLITTSVEQVERGTKVVDTAGSAIGEIVETSKRVHRVLSEIADGAGEQALGVAQTTQAVQDIDTVTQQNAALVEQTAAAAESLHEQARSLAAEVAQFRLPVHA